MSNLLQRGITGAIFVAVIVCAIIFKSWVFHSVFGLIALVGLNEFYGLFKKSGNSPHATLGVIFGFLIYTSGIALLYVPESAQKYLIGFSFMAFTVIALAELYRKKKTPFENIGVTLLGIFYVVLPMLLLNFIIEFDPDSFDITHFWPVLTIFILVWCSDTFAYLIGRKIGKHKLFERISPKKSWEGFFGGMLFSIIGAITIAYFTEQSYFQYIIYGVIISAFGTIGDLIESMLKRSLGIKDSGNILPGHGGILDRFDAVLFVIPIIYFLHTYIFI
ncbi:MAG: phosphatidate cytidylyltransferase [Crocinitomix sp.]|jgi:phosphatidate cytidylyltransferase